MLFIDQEKCKRDRICAAECPMLLIEFTEKGAFPSPIVGAEELCIKCGHCVSVCPHSAISLKEVASGDCPPVDQERLPSAEQVELFMKSRRSIRKFKSRPVDRGLLNKIIDIARYAPTGHNTQPVHWLVFEDKSEVQQLAGQVVDWMRYIIKNMPEVAAPMHMEDVVAAWEQGNDRICRHAPHIIMAYGPSEVRTTSVSCSIALTYLELAAYSLGVGACWAGYLGAASSSFPPLMEKLALPEGYKVYGAMMIGYPLYSYHRIPPREPARITWR